MTGNRNMREKIGNVVLDYSQYSGQDYYSEGASEDLLLEVVKNHKETKFNEIIIGQWSWPVLYHLSHIRGNIVEWLPISKEHKVLEIGSGCGAITGTLANKAKEVTCIELSKKRSLINAYRNQDKSNIEIKVGNFQEIEKTLEDKFDYIMLIGVFEYGSSYLQGTNPYFRFLEIIKSHLAKEGKIVIAIENKYGLKYWAGCKEDHVGKYFEGLEGYEESSGVRTFSKKEISRLMEENGLFHEFYYPYPDYKFPIFIYSDKYLPQKGELKDNLRNFDGDRVVLFDETKVYDGLIENEMFPFYSNSFLVIAGEEKGNIQYEKEKILYVKYSNERAKDRMIRTDITEEEEKTRKVKKTALTKEAAVHISALKEHHEKLGQLFDKTKFVPNRFLGLEQERAVFQYIEGETLESRLDVLLQKKEYDNMLRLISEYRDMLLEICDKNKLEIGDSFIEVFGPWELGEEFKWAPVSDIDLIFDNILVTTEKEEQWHVIDYEWTFSFPIPMKFILYRALYYYIRSPKRKAFADFIQGGIFEYFHLSKDEIEAFQKMEHHFQKFIVGDTVSLHVAYALIAGLTLDFRKLVQDGTQMKELHVVKVYYDYGNDFQPDGMRRLRGNVSKEKRVSVDIPVEPGIVRIRIDPTEFPCILKIHEFSCKGRNGFLYYVNGEVGKEHIILFPTDDAQIIVEELTGKEEFFHLEYTVDILEDSLFKGILSSIEEFKQELAEKNMEEMEGQMDEEEEYIEEETIDTLEALGFKAMLGNILEVEDEKGRIHQLAENRADDGENI